MKPAARLALLGAVSALGWVVMAAASWTSRRADVLAFVALLGALFAVYAAAAWIAGRAPARGAGSVVLVVVLFAGAFRAILVFAGLPAERWVEAARDDLTSRAVGYRPFLLYDNDVWRYLWDGHVAACGIPPYRFSPAEIEARTPDGHCPLESDLWWDVFDRVSFPEHRTIYPPVAQYVFRMAHAVAPGSVLAFKSLMALLDTGTCVLLVGLLRRLHRAPGEVLLYAWNPQVIQELAGSGHVDAAAVFLLVLTVHLVISRRTRAALTALAAAVLTKVAPILVAGLVLRRAPRRTWPWLAIAGGVLVAPLARHLDGWLAGTAAFVGSWTFNAGAWRLAAWALDPAWPGSGGAIARGVLGAAAVAAAIVWTARDPGGDVALVRRIALILGTLVLVSAAVMPWYLLWALPFFVLAGWRSWIVLTAASVLSYLTYVDQTERVWWLVIEYGAFAAAAVFETWTHRRSGVVARIGTAFRG